MDVSLSEIITQLGVECKLFTITVPIIINSIILLFVVTQIL